MSNWLEEQMADVDRVVAAWPQWMRDQIERRRTKSKGETMPHKQVSLTHPKTGEVIEVDAKLKTLILELWDTKVVTYCSCQDNDATGFGYIKIADARDKKRYRAARKHATELITEVGLFVPIWADFSPQDVFIRFKTKDIAKITRLFTEGI